MVYIVVYININLIIIRSESKYIILYIRHNKTWRGIMNEIKSGCGELKL